MLPMIVIMMAMLVMRVAMASRSGYGDRACDVMSVARIRIVIMTVVW